MSEPVFRQEEEPRPNEARSSTPTPGRPGGSIGPRLHNTLSYSVAALVPLSIMMPESATPQGVERWLVLGLWMFHFARRSAEALWVHRYSGRPVPPSDYLVEYLYYWGFAAWIAFGLAAPDWRLPTGGTTIAGLSLFALGEIGNTWAHLKLRGLRSSAGQSQRSVPRGGAFELVSCPHYLFEITTWLGFALLTRVWGALAFVIVGAIILGSYAFGRHQKYRREFDGQDGRALYPGSRKALVPFLF